MKKIKLLHIFSAPQSVYYFMDKQMQFMNESGFDVHVVVPDDGYLFKKLLEREKNITFHRVPIKRDISLFFDLYSLFKIIFILIKINPDILHVHTPKASLLGSIAGRLTFQKHIIFQMHGLVSGGSYKKGLVYFMERTTCLLSTKIFAVSNSLKEFAIENNYVSR